MQVDACAESVVEAIVRLIREEVALAISQRRNWKITVHGSAAGDVRTVVEHYSDVVKHGVPITRE